MSTHIDAHEEAILDLALGAAAPPRSEEEAVRLLTERLASCDACTGYATRLLFDLPVIAAGLGLDHAAQKALERHGVTLIKRALDAASDRAADQAASAGSAKIIPFRRRALQGSAVALLAAAAAMFVVVTRDGEWGVKANAGAGPLTVEVTPADDDVVSALEARRRAIDACTSSTGSLRVTFQLGTDGRAAQIVVSDANGSGAAWAPCLESEMQRVSFPLLAENRQLSIVFRREEKAR